MLDLNDAKNWDIPLFPVSVAAQAALITPGTLRQWIVRERMPLWKPAQLKLDQVYWEAAPSLPAESAGKAALLTLRAVLHLSAASRLVSKGVSVEDAYGAAMHWAHVGDSYAYWGEMNDEHREEMRKARQPLDLYPPPAWTFLIHHAGSDARVVRVEMKKVDGKSVLPFDFSDLFASGGPAYTPPTIVFLNMVDRYARGVCEGYLR